MSLGPPFDGSPSGERWTLGAGAATLVSLVAAVGFALLASDRTLGESFRLNIMVHTPGPLRTGAEVRMAGRQIGEIVAIRGTGFIHPAGPKGADADPPTVELEARVLRSWQPYLYKNATYFASTPNVLTEAVLEVGPPARGVEPGPPVKDGDKVLGADPPDIDRFLQTIYLNLSALRTLSRDLGPDWDDFRGAVGHLMDSADGLSDVGQLARIGVQGDRAVASARALAAALGQVNAVPRTRALANELSAALAQMDPGLHHLALQLAAVDQHLTGITRTLGPRQRQQLLDAVELYRKALGAGDRMSQDLRWLLSYVERGRGTIGGFRNDVQIFDELKETHRELKHESWRLLFKGKDRGQRHLR